jgi:hypothetical protein
MTKTKQPSDKKIHADADLTPSDVRVWLAALAAGDHASSETVQTSQPAKPKGGSAARTARRRPRPGGEYLGRSA